MFNKGKPYVPPPTRAMGSAHQHDGLHDIHDELELATEVITVTPGGDAHTNNANASAEQEVTVATGETQGAFGTPETENNASNSGWTPAPSNGGGIFGANSSRPTREASSVLGNGMTFEGDISGVGQLVIEGTVKGDVRVSQVLINENGSVEGTVHADVLEVRGRVTGAIIAKQVHLHSSSRVEGDVTQEQLTVDRGAWFSGRSTQARREEDAVAPAAAVPADA